MSIKKGFILVVLGGIFFLGGVIFRYERLYSFSSLFTSWIIITSRGYYGDVRGIEELSAPVAYKEELLGDILYIEGDSSGALLSYKKSWESSANPRVQTKINLLSGEKTALSSKEYPINSQEIIRGTIERIEKDSSHRSEYFPSKGEQYTITPPLFEERQKNIIDW